MNAQHSTSPTSRVEFVATGSRLFLESMINKITFEGLKEFADGAEALASERSHEMDEYLAGDMDALTNHAAYVRTLAGKIVLLRDGLVPALEIDRNNLVLRIQAISAMSYIRAECEAMFCFLR